MSIAGTLKFVWHCQECSAYNVLVHPVGSHEVDRVDLIPCVECKRVNAVTTRLSISIDTETTRRSGQADDLPHFPEDTTLLK